MTHSVSRLFIRIQDRLQSNIFQSTRDVSSSLIADGCDLVELQKYLPDLSKRKTTPRDIPSSLISQLYEVFRLCEIGLIGYCPSNINTCKSVCGIFHTPDN